MRRTLNAIYSAGLALSALAMVAIAAMVLAQVLGRVADRALTAFGQPPLGFAIPSLAEFGGFLFVASAFLALPSALRGGAHVRVTILSQTLKERPTARVIEAMVLTTAAALAAFATWHSALQVADSWQFNTLSYGMVPVPLWIPQGAMTLGLALFLVSLLDELTVSLKGYLPAFRVAEMSRDIGESGD